MGELRVDAADGEAIQGVTSGPAKDLAARLESRKGTTRATLIAGIVLTVVGLVAGFTIDSGWFLVLAPAFAPWFVRRARERAMTAELLRTIRSEDCPDAH